MLVPSFPGENWLFILMLFFANRYVIVLSQELMKLGLHFCVENQLTSTSKFL